MATYIIEKNNIDSDPIKNEVIEGNSAEKALKKRFTTPLHRISTNAREDADLIVVKGRVVNGKPSYLGRAIRYCFAADDGTIQIA